MPQRTKLGLALAGIALVLLAPAAHPQQEQAPVAASPDASYAIGFDLGQFIAQRLQEDGVEASLDDLLAGVSDALRQAPSRLNSAQMRDVLGALADEVEGNRAASRIATDPVYRALAEENLRRSQRFHEVFGEQDRVVTLPSGVQYLVVTEGEGETATPDDTVIVSFECKLISGLEVADQEDVELLVRGTVPGGQEVLTTMRPGARWKVAIPPSLGFAEVGSPPEIGPNETLIVDIELHAVKAGE